MELTTKDRADRDKLLKRWDHGIETFFSQVAVLAELRHRRLYKESHSRFQDFCVERLGFTAARARNLGALGGIKVARPGIPPAEDELTVPDGVRLKKVHRAELLRLPAPKRQAVLDRAVDAADRAMPAGAPVPKLTAKLIKEAVAADADIGICELDIPEQAFVDRHLWIAIQSQLSTIKRDLEKLNQRTSARFMPLDPIVGSFREVHAALKHGMPYCWCTRCGGGLTEREDCDACKGLGFNTLTMFKQADKGQQAAVRLWNSETTN